jgi:hypothetical protein
VVHNGVLTNDREAKKLLENKGEILKILVRNNQEFSSMENILEKKIIKIVNPSSYFLQFFQL